MPPELKDFTPEQQRFLAALEACGRSAPEKLARTMAPLTPPAFEDLIRRGRKLGWIEGPERGSLGLSRDLPETIRYGLKLINTAAQVSEYIERLRAKGRARNLDPKVYIKLLSDAGRTTEAADVELELAHGFLRRRDHDQAYQYISRAVGRLHNHIMGGGDGADRVFVDAVLELSSVSFAVGRGMQVLSSYLRTAVRLAEASGNVRSHALACLHLGRLLAYFDQVPEGLSMLAQGGREVERLGDDDILKAAAEFLGLYYNLLGRLDESLPHFERAEHHFIQEEERPLVYPMILWAMGLTLFLTGQVPRALGLFQRYLRSAEDMGLPAVASIARATLGFSLAVIRKKPEALFHLKASLKEATESRNAYSLFIAQTGLAVISFHDGDLDGAHRMLSTAATSGEKARSALLYVNMHILDLLAAFHHHGLPPAAPWLEYEKELERGLSDPNAIHRGISLRRRAEDHMEAGRSASLVMEDLAASRDHLERSGAYFALKDTLIAIARLKIREGAQDEARELIQEVGRQIRSMGLEPDYLPASLKGLLKGQAGRDPAQTIIARYFGFLHQLDAAEDEDELFHQAIQRLSRIMGAERGALFWSSDQQGGGFELRAGYNFSKRELHSGAFKLSLKWIRRAFREKRHFMFRPEAGEASLGEDRIVGLLCIPIQAGSEVRGVLYYDNSFLNVNFDLLAPPWIPILIDHTNWYVSRVLERIKLREQASRLAADKSIQLERIGADPILAQAPTMLEVLSQAEKAARSEATLLVTGETGTGKELLVSRVHKQSPRAAGPFIVVDSTTIPENLVESELFGHEKGAFTGADVRKRGRIELAHLGTLFIDEIGELPLPVQAKLLRALETKTFYRVGGTQAVKSDFRLVAATNRRLADEVAAGRFRQDLYFRLNVIPIVLPPLRERGEDVIHLARHFLSHYCRKYNASGLDLTARDQAEIAAYSWPGNVRELKNVLERAVILSGGGRLVLDIPSGRSAPGEPSFSETPTMDELQRRYIRYVLDKTGGRIYGPGGAAEVLGMNRSTLYTRMYKLGMRKTSAD